MIRTRLAKGVMAAAVAAVGPLRCAACCVLPKCHTRLLLTGGIAATIAGDGRADDARSGGSECFALVRVRATR
ncbi:MAG: hypothetical protein HC869_21405 [Rhodospirillales bacterium]|nr:hypothetical protein [Rhodospirillales bacterium]